MSREYCVCEIDFKMVALCLAQEERLSETVKQFTCLYDKTTVGYREKDVVSNAWKSVADQLDFAENGKFSKSMKCMKIYEQYFEV